MTEAQDRKTAAGIIRGIGAGAAFIPVVGGPLAAAFELAAKLVEGLGLGKAEEMLKKVAEDPVPLLDAAALKAQEDSVIADELKRRAEVDKAIASGIVPGPSTPVVPPPNPFGDEGPDDSGAS